MEHDGRIQIGDQIIAVSYMFDNRFFSVFMIKKYVLWDWKDGLVVKNMNALPEDPSLVPRTCVEQPKATSTHIHVDKNKILQ